MKSKVYAALLAVFFIAGPLSPLFAEEAQFGYVYTTDLLPKGHTEVEQWMTWRHGRANGEYEVWEGRTAFEYGVSDRFQAAFYANYNKTHFARNGVDGASAPPETFAELTPQANETINTSKFVGVSAEGIYRVLSPFSDPVGLAFYLEPTIGDRTRELEERMIIQKNFLNDTLILAGNVTFGQELRLLPGDPDADPDSEEIHSHWDHETDMNFGLAASYRVMPEWFAGFEFLNEREFSSLYPFQSEERTNSAYYLGPSFHYGGKKFFVTATFLKQMPWATDFTGEGLVVNGRSNADDFENYRIRVKIGIPF